jgi:uncharacterized membrane protein YgcG
VGTIRLSEGGNAMRLPLTIALLAALAIAQPAWAVVEDTAGAFGPAQAQALERRLAQLGPHRFDVLVTNAPVGGTVAEAERLFVERNLGPRDGAIVVSLDTRQVGVHLGDGFAERGVGTGVIQRTIASRFAPPARQGDLSGAIAALASGLVAAGAQSGAPVAGAPGRQAPETPGFPWWLVAIPAAAGAFWLLNRRGGKRRSGAAGRAAVGDPGERLRALRQRQSQLLEGALKLDEASRLGKFASGTTAETYGSLANRAGTLLGEAGAFGDRLDEAESQLKQGRRGEAEAILDALEPQVLPLSAEVAAAVTGIDAMSDDDVEAARKLASARARIEALKGRGVPGAHVAPLETRLAEGERFAKEQDSLAALIIADEVHQGLDRLEGRIVAIEPAVAWAALPEQAEALANRLGAMRETYRTIQARSAEIDLGADPMLENHLNAAERALTTAPVDLPRAQSAMAEAQEALKGYIHHVETESDKLAERQARQANQPMPMGGYGLGGWMPGPIILLNDFGSHAHHGGYGGGFGASGGGDWGGGGLSGGGDWGGGGSSGGGGW